MVQTGSSLLLKLTMTKLVHTGSCAWQANTYLWRKMVEIGSSFLFKYNLMLTTWLAVTSSIWSSLCYTVALTSSNWFLLVVVHDKQIHIYGESVFSTTSKELASAFKILHGRPGSTKYDRCETEAHTNAKEDSWALQQVSCCKSTSPTAKSADSTQQRQLGTSNCECEARWSWAQKLTENTFKQYKQDCNKSCFKQKNTAWKAPKREKQLYRFLIYRTTRRCTTPPPVAAAHLDHSEGEEDNQSLSMILTPKGFDCD